VIAAIVLAAGASRRFGSQKMLAPIAGRPLVRWTVEHVLASPGTLSADALGSEAQAVRDALAGLPVRVVTNARYTEGLSTSLDAGLDALGDSVRAAVVVLGDQPSVAPETIDALIDAYRDGGKPIVVPVYRGRRGNPVLFDAALFDELRTVRGDRGARDVIAHEPARVASAPLDLALPRDVDEPDDLEILERQFAVPTGPSHDAPASERERGLR